MRVLVEGNSVDSSDAVVIDVECPVGFRRVWTGAVKPSDRFLSLTALFEKYVVEWVELGVPQEGVYQRAEVYACLIRRGEGAVEQPCERCKVTAKDDGYRFCAMCRGVVIQQRNSGR